MGIYIRLHKHILTVHQDLRQNPDSKILELALDGEARLIRREILSDFFAFVFLCVYFFCNDVYHSLSYLITAPLWLLFIECSAPSIKSVRTNWWSSITSAIINALSKVFSVITIRPLNLLNVYSRRPYVISLSSP